MVLESKYVQVIQLLLTELMPGVEVWAFGSRVTGSPKPYSDLDLVLVSDLPLDLSKRAALSLAFEEADLPFRVDVLELRQLPPSLRAEVERAHEVLQPQPAQTR